MKLKNIWLSQETYQKIKKKIQVLFLKKFYLQKESLGQNIKGSEDNLNIAINMAREGKSRDEIIAKTGLREDDVEAIYTYYKK